MESLSLVGRVAGEVRRLSAFDKKRHKVPDQTNPTTQAFLAKLCEAELEEACEALFQAARHSFGYRRKEIELSLSPGSGRLETKDFVFELRYFLEEEDASSFIAESELVSASSLDLLESSAFDNVVGSRFDRLRCGLRGKVSVEQLIDAVEDDASGDLSVEYPSDCSECSIRMDGIEVEIVIDGATLEARVGRMSNASSLLQIFGAFRKRVEENEQLAGLLD